MDGQVVFARMPFGSGVRILNVESAGSVSDLNVPGGEIRAWCPIDEKLLAFMRGDEVRSEEV